MSDWLTLLFSYSIIDFIPVEAEIYIRLFERANAMLWPLPLISTLAVIFLACLPFLKKNHYFIYFCSLTIVSASWLLVGFVFFLQLLSELTWVGHYLGIIFMLQGVLLLLNSCLMFRKSALSCVQIYSQLQSQKSQFIWAAALVLFISSYAMVPWLSQRSWQSIELFAIAPDPTCLATIAVILATRALPRWLLIIPLLWCLVSACLAYAMGLYSGFILLCAVIVLFANRLFFIRSNIKGNAD